MCTHNLCFEQKYENSKKNSNENCDFYSREKSLYIAWACLRNVFLHRSQTVEKPCNVTYPTREK